MCLVGCMSGTSSAPNLHNRGVLETRAVILAGQVVEATVLNVDGELILQGDIVVEAAPSTPGATSAALIETPDRRWSGGVIPYTIADDLPNPDRVLEAIRRVEAVTAIRFVEHAGQVDYVDFVTRDANCWAALGRKGGRQEIQLADEKCVAWTIVHEILHALGFLHEQTRHDRDDYVRIHFDNIVEEFWPQFEIVDANHIQRVEYDYDSIMHYPSFHFATDPSRPTITKLDGGLIENIGVLSPSDIASINQRYEEEVSSICRPGEHDEDGDYLCSGYDNCPNRASLDQTDRDNDGVGDLCDMCPDDPDNDEDGDGLCAAVDNCPNVANADQQDQDGDGYGDACDPCPLPLDGDPDDDGICASADNCPNLGNPDQTDSDGDGQGDACDLCPNDLLNDVDADSVCAPQDNCPIDSNPDQLDSDDDGVGDVCEPPAGGRIEGGSCSVGPDDGAPWSLWMICVICATLLWRRRRGSLRMVSPRRRDHGCSLGRMGSRSPIARSSRAVQ